VDERFIQARPRVIIAGVVAAIAAVAGMLAACGGESDASRPATPSDPGTVAVSQAVAATATPVPADLKLMKAQPDTGHSGDRVTISGDGLPPGKSLELMWATWQGKYVTEVARADVKYIDRSFEKKRVSLGSFPVDSAGKLSAVVTIPDDYGETHDIFGVVDGTDVSRTGFRIIREVTFSPTSGPVGTPITITVAGLGLQWFTSTMAPCTTTTTWAWSAPSIRVAPRCSRSGRLVRWGLTFSS